MSWTIRYKKSYNKWFSKKYPISAAEDGPNRKCPYPKVTSSNGLTAAIIKFLIWEGHHAERTNNMGRPIDRRKTYIDIIGRTRVIGSLEWQKGTGTKGTSDIKADITHPAYRFPIPVKIEVKWNKDRMSDEQKEYQHTVESNGGVYVVAKTIQGFFEWYDGFMLSL